MLSWYHWLFVVILPVLAVCAAAWRCRRYIRSVSDFLVAGRCAGRYVLISSGVMGGMSVVTLIGYAEAHYNSGWVYGYWNNLLTPIGIVMGLYGWISYRFRETRAMSAGQFFEMRYSRGLRRLASVLRGTADVLANSIGPAVAVRFLVYLLGIPHRIQLFGVQVRTFPFLLTLLLALALFMIFAGGRLALLVTDALQCLISYPLFVVVTVFVICRFPWFAEIAPTMADRVPGESFLDPYDIQNLRDFNMFGLVVAIYQRFIGGAFIGNGYTTVARAADASKMSGIVSSFGSGMSGLLPMMLCAAVFAVMLHANHADTAHAIRTELSVRAIDETVADPAVEAAVRGAVEAVPVQRHEIGVDPPLSRAQNIDTPYFEAVHGALLETLPAAEANAKFQGWRTTFLQQMMPSVVRSTFPRWLCALLVLQCILLVVSTDDTRIFDSTTTWVQDFVLPFFKKPPSPRMHLAIFKAVALLVGVVFWCGSMFFVQMDYINMFVTIVCSVWIAGAGAIVTLGLYWRRGTTAGAYAALLSGGGLSLAGILVQRNWASHVYPWLAAHGWDGAVRHALEAAARPFNPWIDWKVPDALWPVKFPVNSLELSFFAGIAALLLYVAVSLLTCRTPFDMERMLHRGKWSDDPEAAAAKAAQKRFTWKRLGGMLVGITPEHTRGDRILSWTMFGYSFVYGFLVVFVGVSIAARVFHWGVHAWAIKFFVTGIVIALVKGVVTTVWFSWGTTRDLRRLFSDLEKRKRDDLDNGMVEGHVSLADRNR